MATTRPLRADARRNRDRLLEVAVRALSQEGPDVPLDAIAKEAGVGIGTLYRHFPTREALIDAAYRNELDRLAGSVDDLLAALPPDQALRAWMDHFASYLATKRGLGDALRALIASGGDPFAHSRELLTTAVTTLLAAGRRAGSLRADVSPDDVLVSLSGLSLATADRGDLAQTGRLLDLLMDALRPPTPA
jgi:AcrR family transcriptional regulator